MAARYPLIPSASLVPPRFDRVRERPRLLPSPMDWTGQWSMPLIAIIVGALIAGWAVATLFIEPLRLNVAAPHLQVGAAAGSAAVRLFCAIVLVLFVAEGACRRRLHWVAGGLVVLGLASAGLGFLAPVTGITLDPNQSLVLAMITLAVADALFAIGLVPATPPRFTRRAAIAMTLIVGAAALGVVVAGDRMPALVQSGTWSGGASALSVDHLTPWYWLMLALPVGLAFTAAVAAVVRYSPSDRMAGWLVLAMVVFAGAHLHHLLWPSAYQPVLTSANLLRAAAAAILALGGLVELRRVAAERALLLAAEKAHSARMAALATLKAEFTAMVAHELNNPVAALTKIIDVLATGELDAERQAATIAKLRTELSSWRNWPPMSMLPPAMNGRSSMSSRNRPRSRRCWPRPPRLPRRCRAIIP